MSTLDFAISLKCFFAETCSIYVTHRDRLPHDTPSHDTPSHTTPRHTRHPVTHDTTSHTTPLHTDRLRRQHIFLRYAAVPIYVKKRSDVLLSWLLSANGLYLNYFAVKVFGMRTLHFCRSPHALTGSIEYHSSASVVLSLLASPRY